MTNYSDLYPDSYSLMQGIAYYSSSSDCDFKKQWLRASISKRKELLKKIFQEDDLEFYWGCEDIKSLHEWVLDGNFLTPRQLYHKLEQIYWSTLEKMYAEAWEYQHQQKEVDDIEAFKSDREWREFRI